MTQSSQDPHGYPDRETPDQGGDPELRGNGAELAERIWDRYGGSPGLIPTAATLGLARRASRLSTGRLALLADVQRRWAPANIFFPQGPSALPYARPPAFAGPVSPSAYVAQSTPETPPRSFGPTDPIPSATGLTSSRRTGSARSGSAGQAIQRRGTAPEPVRPAGHTIAELPLHAGPLASSSGGALQPAGREAQPSTEVRAAPPTATGAGDLGTAILQRHLSGPAERAIQRWGASQPPSGGMQSSTAASNVGTAILRRHLSGPAEWAIQRRGAPPESAHSDIRMSQQGFARGRADFATPQRLAPSARIAPESLPVADQPAAIERRMGKAAPPAAAGAGQMFENFSGSRAGLTALGAGWTSVSRATTRVGETIAMRQLAMPLSRTPLPETAMFKRAFGASREPYAASPELPLQRAAERGPIRARIESAMLVSAPASISGTPRDLPLQRAAAEAPVATPATEISGTVPPPPAEEPPSPTGATPSLQGPDLERLADEVIAIIERRLTIERESLGL